mmetsp:Transcript_25415/g.56223  ORF Transcript_25415/g.56223 Transcript_25415/m.56223 type:complete len:80 (+) Transcript_25415:353-592(+)
MGSTEGRCELVSTDIDATDVRGSPEEREKEPMHVLHLGPRSPAKLVGGFVTQDLAGGTGAFCHRWRLTYLTGNDSKPPM